MRSHRFAGFVVAVRHVPACAGRDGCYAAWVWRAGAPGVVELVRVDEPMFDEPRTRPDVLARMARAAFYTARITGTAQHDDEHFVKCPAQEIGR